MKSKTVLLLENIHQSATQFLEEKGFDAKTHLESFAEKDLINELQNCEVRAVGIRSKTNISKNVVDLCERLEAVGAFCIGTNQVDLEACAEKGIPVFNAPYSNTRSVAELVLAEIIALSRKLCDVSSLLHKGVWQKSAKGSYEVRGKSLGIIGYGHIGTQVGILAEAFGLNVYYYDVLTKLPLGNATSSKSLNDLLEKSDFISLHVPETLETKNMISEQQIRRMKKGAYLINASRGTVVDLKALAEAIKLGHLAGAAIDVYPIEPRKNGEGFESELLGLENVILSPHIGGSTEEAQKSIGQEVSLSLQKYFSLGDTMGAVNFPKISPAEIAEGKKRLCHIHLNQPGVLGEVNSLLSSYKINITYQSLATNDKIGYLIVDFEDKQGVSSDLYAELAQKNYTLKLRFI